MHEFPLAARRAHRRQQVELGFPLLRVCRWRLASRWGCVTKANAERSVEHLAALVSACLDLA